MSGYYSQDFGGGSRDLLMGKRLVGKEAPARLSGI